MAFPTLGPAVRTAQHRFRTGLCTIFVIVMMIRLHKHALFTARCGCHPTTATSIGLHQLRRRRFKLGHGQTKKTLTPPNQADTVAPSRAPHKATVQAPLKMPNERDASVAKTPPEADPIIEQAALDVARGLQDTTSGAELNRAYKKLK